MKHLINSRAGVLLATGLGIGLLLSGASQYILALAVLPARAGQTPQPDVRELRQPQIKTDSLDGRLSDQSHAMADVGYHFANLWFAADKQNWPLSDYYLNETRSHLRWAVQLHPVRQTKLGEVDLKGILDAVDNSFLTPNTSGRWTSARPAATRPIIGCCCAHSSTWAMNRCLG